MRIIAGSLGGRQFETPSGNLTHPMSEKARGGLFNTLGEIEGLSVLDAFAGSGALSFEAVSRGAAQAVAIDNNRRAQNAVLNNIEKLGLAGKVKLVKAQTGIWSDNNPELIFDLVLCDPPYDKLQLDIVQKLTGHVRPGGLMVLSWPGKLDQPQLQRVKLLKKQNYGDAQLVFYRNIP